MKVGPLGTPRLFGILPPAIPLLDELVLFQPTYIRAANDEGKERK